ncbi:phosphoribosylformylglycinamidine synthase subunit PurL [Cellulomonas dongxiuzhuiae]|uniref:Phosphoribosylformylglycinamidine synthase subunit PurL n=1 Tax=Cellulomonas dongxiuzhuiae TaxID=2819979 RepID=A0ABX8GIE8_9CELL|nr:phosphoribosylformylglycinamidine synthase subunit PurL [Cellulomonas dongxiuzhuiae]MBO3088176.1 phosphoribosylformylglycinamidine synthase subunit PurL [Cellulomonas dongxiuzhuiae]MBO3094477.1 phosphoribosylformylglycinamidine synthase subunit PurL [Cellulomonas dongxiuzhuiae]QWC15502.1 phosphoribosylformylglycinamidine synthase subunit PurL [Cellulomonas dongxiuzhuiae]
MTTAPARPDVPSVPHTSDTVEHAAETPDLDQPYAELGLKADEYQRIRDILDRRPTAAELAMYSVMWSEHCSYKSSKTHLRQFGEKTTPAMREHLLVGIGENAGVVDIGDGWAVTFKVESHNHPSYVEPYQGAATGVGGIVRDIISMGARPVAVMDQLRFGDPAHPDTARVVHGVVAGVGGYGNSLGLPNIGGELVFDASYQGNPLVNALCLGVLRHEDIHLANASGVGNKVVLFGARTGGDGIGGASILASETFDDTKPSKRPSVQVGDPFMEKVLIECCLELYAARVVEGIQDLGAAGISCATSELASNGDGGMHVDLENVLLRDPTLTAGEILMSESQERMMAVVSPEKLDEFLAITGKWDVETAVIGEVTGTGRLTIDHFGQRIVDVDPKTVAHDGPVYDRPYARPAWQDALVADSVSTPEGAARYARPAGGDDLRATLLQLLASPNLASPAWVTDQYDRFVQGNTALAQPDDSGVVRVDEATGLGVALATDANGRYTKLDPYTGAQLALAEAYRNVATVGARPLAVTDCLNFGSPEHPDTMWQLVEAIRGLADACQTLEVPVTGGNVSLYNGTGEPGQIDSAIHPTPVVGVLGVLDDVAEAVPSGWTAPGQAVYLLGTTRAELDGSAWADVAHDHLGGVPPRVDLDAERRLAQVLIAAARDELVDAAHDLSEGGLALALVESSLRYGVGVQVGLDALCERDGVTPFEALFSESQARAIVAVPRSEEVRLHDLCTARGVPALRLGETAETCTPGAGTPADDEDHAHAAAVEVRGLFTLPLTEAREVWEATLPRLFG